MNRYEFDKEINSIEKYYYEEYNSEDKDKMYEFLHNIPLDTLKRAKSVVFRQYSTIPLPKALLRLCVANFDLETKDTIRFMYSKGYFVNDELIRRVKHFYKFKNFPNWFIADMKKFKKIYLKELLQKKE